MMKNIIIFSLLAICSTPLWSVENVRIRTDVDLVMTGTTSTNIALYSEKPSGDGSAENAPAKVYLPMQKDAPENTKLYYIGARNGAPNIFNTSTNAYVVNFPLRVNTDGSTRYLYAAVKDSSNIYRVAKPFGIISSNSTNYDVNFTLSPAEICVVVGTNCANLAASSSTEAVVSANVYFFVSDASSYAYGAAGDPITLTQAPMNTGMFFQVNMSNSVATDSEVRITLNTIRSGDKRLILPYTASGTIAAATAKAVRIYNHGGPASATNAPIGSYTTGAIIGNEYSYGQNGEITLTGLTNEATYTLSVFFVDKYGFATTLSNDALGSPKTIEELLKKQACFLLTAGFGEEHYVISYFRHFRDTVLASSYLGRKFIHVYYELAPKYALIIYQHDTIRTFIRGAAYVLYFVFNYYLLIFISFAAVVSGIYLYKNREKIKI